jgi:hypothetical protein
MMRTSAAKSSQFCHREERSDEAIPDGQTVRGWFKHCGDCFAVPPAVAAQ